MVKVKPAGVIMVGCEAETERIELPPHRKHPGSLIRGNDNLRMQTYQKPPQR